MSVYQTRIPVSTIWMSLARFHRPKERDVEPARIRAERLQIKNKSLLGLSPARNQKKTGRPGFLHLVTRVHHHPSYFSTTDGQLGRQPVAAPATRQQTRWQGQRECANTSCAIAVVSSFWDDSTFSTYTRLCCCPSLLGGNRVYWANRVTHSPRPWNRNKRPGVCLIGYKASWLYVYFEWFGVFPFGAASRPERSVASSLSLSLFRISRNSMTKK